MRAHHIVGAAAVLTAAIAFLPARVLAAPPNPRRTAVVEVVERVRAAVVNIHSERTVRGPAAEELFAHTPSQNRINGMGTGILIDPRGYLVTNQHVVEDVSVIRVRLSDGTTHSARVLTRDHDSDLALLKIDVSRPLPTMPLGTSSDLMVGETVIAIGNAYGYEHTVTVGVISALKRDVTLNKEISYKQLIQTDAAINPGNSGGPLLNVNGELIGVNVAIRAGAQGIGFAIPVDSMLRTTADMLSVRRRNGTWHGLVCRDCVGEPEGEKGTTMPEASATEKAVSHAVTAPVPAASLARWLLVERAEASSPASRAGLQAGDIVLRAGDLQVSCGLDLERAFLDRPAGDAVPLVIRRKGEEKSLKLVLQPVEQAGVPAGAELIWRKLGIRLTPVGAETVAQNNQQLHGGLAIVELEPAGLAAKAGVQRGDILVGLHQWETLTVENVNFVLTHPDLHTFHPLRFFIIRGGQIHKGWFQQVE
jgi:serine protease Do